MHTNTKNWKKKIYFVEFSVGENKIKSDLQKF
jgi:hypothetical protein